MYFVAQEFKPTLQQRPPPQFYRFSLDAFALLSREMHSWPMSMGHVSFDFSSGVLHVLAQCGTHLVTVSVLHVASINIKLKISLQCTLLHPPPPHPVHGEGVGSCFCFFKFCMFVVAVTCFFSVLLRFSSFVHVFYCFYLGFLGF